MRSSRAGEPGPILPAREWEHYCLYERVKAALASLPFHFDTETYIEGISATDIFTLNSALGATIEEQVVATLNRIRQTWDPDGTYPLYGFVRQPQTFPDVVLRSLSRDVPPGKQVLLGIELKGWYLLSKEREPSFRYTVAAAACTDADLLVCVPWALKNVISGHPMVFDPYVISAKQAALLRNYHWQHKRETKSDKTIKSPPAGISPYPSKSDQISDVPASDAGGNFGRYARTGIMDDYLKRILQQRLSGIAAEAWLDFFKIFTETTSAGDVAGSIAVLRERLSTGNLPPEGLRTAPATFLEILQTIERSL